MNDGELVSRRQNFAVADSEVVLFLLRLSGSLNLYRYVSPHPRETTQCVRVVSAVTVTSTVHENNSPNPSRHQSRSTRLPCLPGRGTTELELGIELKLKWSENEDPQTEYQ